MQLNPIHVNVGTLLFGRLFRIPDYQRAYSWGQRQRTDLFEDIDEAYRSKQNHFMATVVALRVDTQRVLAEEFNVVEIVDGQQRITTLVILLKALSKAMNVDDDADRKMKQDLDDLLVKSDEHQLILLQTNHDSSSVFATYIRSGVIADDEIKTAADKKLIDAMTECEAYVSRWAEADPLIELYATIRNKLSMIYHEIGDEAVVYRVFEVLNSRGLDVKWIDKTKSQLMARLFEHLKDEARRTALKEMRSIWRDVYYMLGLDADLGDEALRFAGTWKLADRPNKILGQEPAYREIVTVAGKQTKSVVGAADWLRQVVRKHKETVNDVRRAGVIGISHARFVAVAIRLRGFDAENERDALKRWENVTFRMYGLGNADKRHKVGDYVRLGYEIVADELPVDNIIDRLDEIGSDYGIDQVIKGDNYWGDCYNRWTDQLRYVLFRYDEHIARLNGDPLDDSTWNRIWQSEASKSVEHILPQKSGAEFVHELGNLTMLPPGMNSRLGGKAPKDKVSTYLASGIRASANVAAQITKTKKWDRSDITGRTREIERFIREEWGA